MQIKITPDRIGSLLLIARGDFTMTRLDIGVGVGGRRVAAPDGTRIRTDLYDTLAAASLVERDRAVSLSDGQPVRLTDAGRAVLDKVVPRPPRGRIEVVVHRDPDGETDLTYFLDGEETTARELGVAELHVDPGASGADRQWVSDRESDASTASPAAGAKIRELVGYYA
ncbi:hypothetical protein [Streptomyces sp. bgisy153]|uniref:hypothetical protein n=1 Tax=Streptomyces sp. bgisy153 TaxID=3413793 RepID=UPI003D7631C8